MIREAKKYDYAEMDSIFRASVKALCIKEYERSKVMSWANRAWPERFIQSANEGNKQYVKVYNGEIICFGELNLAKATLQSLFVSPDFAGKGIAQEMIAFLLQKSRDCGLTHLTLDSSLNAVNFYRRHGFTEYQRSEFTTQNGVILPSVKMKCSLNT